MHSDVQIYLRGDRGPDPANPDVLCSQKAIDRPVSVLKCLVGYVYMDFCMLVCIVLLYEAAYGEAMSSQHGSYYGWRTSPIDPQAVYASGGKAHGRCKLYISYIVSLVECNTCILNLS
jgi:hypothetical protein